jgi:hypothetical protein
MFATTNGVTRQVPDLFTFRKLQIMTWERENSGTDKNLKLPIIRRGTVKFLAFTICKTTK